MFRSATNFDKLLDKATSHLQLQPDWVAILQICDLIRQGDVQPKAALNAIKKKTTNSNPHAALYALSVLESCVKNCGILIHDEIGTKQFMEHLKELVKISPHDPVRLKTLELIQTWAYAFRNSPKYRAVQDTLNIMKTEGYKFPALKESDAMFMADTAPEWADGDVCDRCRVVFTFVQRKHHCRACGQVFCGQCSSKVSTLPKFGIEKEVRVCDTCYEQANKPSSTQSKETDLPAEYLNSSLAQQQQVPPRKTAAELQEEEDLNLAIALSQSEAEQKEKEKKRATSALKSNPTPVARPYSPPPSPGSSPSRTQDEDEVEPELAKYLNRKYWEQRQTVIEEHGSRPDVTSPSAPNISSPMSQKVVIAKQQNGEVDTQMEEFVSALRSQVEIFVNRMKSNSSRGRSIANDSSVQTLFLNITAMHSRLLRYIQEQDDSRVYYEGLQDKLTQMKDARAALDALREEHREKLRRQAEEAERQRQMLMAQKLAIMRKKKQEYLQYQRQLALQKIQEQEREMQMRQEQQKQQYILGGYQAVSGPFMGPSQGSPVRHVQYQTPGTTYNPMSPTNQGVYMYGQPSVKQYPMQGYSVPGVNSLPPHMMGPMNNQDQQSAEPTVQGHESMGRVPISAPGMIPQMPNAVSQLQQPGGHQMGPPPPGQPQGPPSHIPQGKLPAGPMPPQQGPPPQITQAGPASQMSMPQVAQGHMGAPPAQIPAGAHAPPGQMGLPPQLAPQQPPSMQPPHVSNAPISNQPAGTIPVPPAATGAPMPAANPQIQGPQGPGLPAMQGIAQIPPPQGQQMQFQSTPIPTTSSEPSQPKEDAKPETAELISFD